MIWGLGFLPLPNIESCLMLDHMTFLQKLWDKGVDIAAAVIATTISAGIAALVATLTWRWNRHRDLKFEEEKLRLQQRVGEQKDIKDRKREGQERYERLERQRVVLAGEALNTKNSDEQADILDRWFEWMKDNNLERLPLNLHMMHDFRDSSSTLRSVSDQSRNPDPRKTAKKLADFIGLHTASGRS